MTFENPRHLRIVGKGYESYTGQFGAYMFENGLSVEKIPLNDRDRIASSIPCLEICEEGEEVEAGPVARMTTLRSSRTEVASLARSTEREKAEEDVRAVIGGQKIPKLYAKELLEKIADKEGISGLRVVAENWKVRSKSIVDLMAMILKAQSDFITNKTAELKGKGLPEEDIAKIFSLITEPDAEPVDQKAKAKVHPVETKVDSETGKDIATVATAAETGDLSAAISGD